MTRKEKEEYFAQYWGQRVVSCDTLYKGDIQPLNALTMMTIFYPGNYEKHESKLILRPLESITDEEVSAMKFNSFKLASEYIEFIYSWPFGETWFQDEIDAARSLGIATPWRSYTVDDLIKQGVLKVKEQ